MRSGIDWITASADVLRYRETRKPSHALCGSLLGAAERAVLSVYRETYRRAINELETGMQR